MPPKKFDIMEGERATHLTTAHQKLVVNSSGYATFSLHFIAGKRLLWATRCAHSGGSKLTAKHAS